jgi:hypothetical protein
MDLDLMEQSGIIREKAGSPRHRGTGHDGPRPFPLQLVPSDRARGDPEARGHVRARLACRSGGQDLLSGLNRIGAHALVCAASPAFSDTL